MSAQHRCVGTKHARREVVRRPVVAILLVTALFAPAAAQQATEDEIKAAFLFNFANFIEWPPASFADPSAPLVIGVTGENDLADALDKATRGKTVKGRSLVIKRLKRTDDFHRLHVLFVGETDDTQIRRVLEAVRGQSTLTVGDARHFDALGGIITVFTEDQRVRFDINVDSAARAQLRISSKLLALAKHVRGGRQSEVL